MTYMFSICKPGSIRCSCLPTMQVQRYSGAFLMSARKQQPTGLRTPSSAVKTSHAYLGTPEGSPLPALAMPMSALLGQEGSVQLQPGSAEDADLGELAEDEEFAVEEHAHRYAARWQLFDTQL